MSHQKFLSTRESKRVIYFTGAAILVITSTISAFWFLAASNNSIHYEILEPESWIGRHFPLFQHVDIRDTLIEGSWVVVFYRDNCKACQSEISSFEYSAKKLAGIPDVPKIAFIEVPQHSSDENTINFSGICPVGKLDDAKHWFVQTPYVVKMQDGIVGDAFRGKTAYKALKSSANTLVSISTNNIDLGEITKAQIGRNELIITNTSEKPVFLNAKAGCGCTDVLLEDRSLLPGHSSVLEIRFDPAKKKKKKGMVSEKVNLIVTNCSEKNLIPIKVSASIK